MGKQTFEYYYSQSYNQAYGYILKKVSNPHTAEDLLMDAFVACYKNFDRFDPDKASFQTWLYVVISNKLKNYYRDKKDYDDIDDYMELVAGYDDDILASIKISEMRDLLSQALTILSDTQRKIVVMRYLKDMQSNEIGEKLGITPGNVRIQLSRALDKIKIHFANNNIKWEF